MTLRAMVNVNITWFKSRMKEIGRIFTPYGSKFGVPKQPGLARADHSKIVLNKKWGAHCVRGLEAGSFIWALFDFHLCEGRAKELSRPPKLGGNEKMGVFATRAPFRPNNIGLSLLRVEKIAIENGQVAVYVQGADMVNETPVFDIKPYHPSADAPWSEFPPPWFTREEDVRLEVDFAKEFAKGLESTLENSFKELVRQTLSLDPRPAYHRDVDRVYVNQLENRRVYWRVGASNRVEVIKVEDVCE